MTAFRIEVDRDRCTGIGICESMRDDRFEVGDDGTLVVHDDSVAEAEKAEFENIVLSCPASALRLVPAS
ncbi:ferredoxin [Agromyces rhizosphaerae]|uniref:Ferredoxin n=1 Tax=Agromyces rhizosphaerae TaxID=88374 RepID=A0A9W6CT88_9MICO|nr:ferredoxin [Agromyces rhizosphaerae]GLI28586.1 ferredoxin [Agromyces rhizosphaerae]